MNYLKRENILEIKESLDKKDILKKISDIMSNQNSKINSSKVFNGLNKREKEISTGLGNGIAMPHAVVKNLTSPELIIFKLKHETDWDSLDNKPVNLVISILVPESDRDSHFDILINLSKFFSNEDNIKKIKSSSKFSIYRMINEISNPIKTKEDKTFDIVGVTSCPTGIAHTYMAAENLTKSAKELGYSIKIETQGQRVENVLSQDEINNAKLIILATDRDIERARFNNKEVLDIKAASAIKDSKRIIKEGMEKKYSKYSVTKVKVVGSLDSSNHNEADMSFDNFKSRMWKSVMSGVSYMLPFVVFGGIMIALSFLIDIKSAGEPNYGSVNVVAQWFNQIGSISMSAMVPILAAYITFSLVGKQGILPGFVVGSIAVGVGPNWVELFLDGNPPSWVDPGAADTVAGSGFIGAILGSFLVAVVLIYMSQKLDKVMPASLRGLSLILIIPLFGTLVSATIFWFVNIPLTYLTWGLFELLLIFNQPYLLWMLGGILGAMMAIDMGGPINKTAYIFGVFMVSSASEAGSVSVEMAAVMAAGMVPPLAISIATSFNRKSNLWDQEDINGGYTNWALGASFITEGAIPFAAKYPKSVMPSIITGSAFTGLMVGALSIGTLAPHGGIFTVALLQSTYFEIGSAQAYAVGIIGWISAIGLGATLSAIMFTILLKKEKNIKLNKKFNFKINFKKNSNVSKSTIDTNKLDSKSEELKVKSI